MNLISLALMELNRASLVDQLVKNPPAIQETLAQFLGWEDLPEKGTASHSSYPLWLGEFIIVGKLLLI